MSSLTRRSISASTAFLSGKGTGRAENTLRIAPSFRCTTALCPHIVIELSLKSSANSDSNAFKTMLSVSVPFANLTLHIVTPFGILMLNATHQSKPKSDVSCWSITMTGSFYTFPNASTVTTASPRVHIGIGHKGQHSWLQSWRPYLCSFITDLEAPGS